MLLESHRGLTLVLEDNAAWLQERARSTEDILKAIFPDWQVYPEDRSLWVREFETFLFESGYIPDTQESTNPRWRFGADQ